MIYNSLAARLIQWLKVACEMARMGRASLKPSGKKRLFSTKGGELEARGYL
jgi:hypothetical protein